jgi:hypothetical protein
VILDLNPPEVYPKTPEVDPKTPEVDPKTLDQINVPATIKEGGKIYEIGEFGQLPNTQSRVVQNANNRAFTNALVASITAHSRCEPTRTRRKKKQLCRHAPQAFVVSCATSSTSRPQHPQQNSVKELPFTAPTHQELT